MPNDINYDTIDLTELLKRPLSDFPDIPTLPAGKHFYGKILGYETGQLPPKRETPDRPGTRFIQLNAQVIEPGEDVEEGDLDGIDLTSVEVNSKFWVTKKGLPILRNFLTSLGFDEEVGLGEGMADSRGMRILFSGSITEGRDKRQFYNVDTIVGVK